MVDIQIELTNQQWTILSSMAAAEDSSIEELIHCSVDEFLEFKRDHDREALKQKALSIVGKYSSGSNDVAVNHDAYLADIYSSTKPARGVPTPQ